MTTERLEYLVERYLRQSETPGEKEELMELVAADNHEESIKLLLDEAREWLSATARLTEEQSERIFAQIQQPTAKVIPVTKAKQGWWKWVAAASILLVLSAATWFLVHQTSSSVTTTAHYKNDVAAPAANKAILTLAGGQQIILDSAGNGQLATEGNVKVEKLADGQIAYQNGDQLKTQDSELKTSFNTLTVPRGSRPFYLRLSDGSQVWLNAASSLRYPAAFTGKDRRVEITGEAYFEVAHDAAKPFKVSKNNIEVTVLGTHFNVNAYDDEQEVKVTLLEGAVRVTKNLPTQQAGAEGVTLKPGEQAIVQRSALSVERSADLEQAIAWKNGRFLFDGADIQTILRQVARWYDIDINYEANITDKFVADISRNVPVSELLQLLELTQGVHFKIEGEKITVMK